MTEYHDSVLKDRLKARDRRIRQQKIETHRTRAKKLRRRQNRLEAQLRLKRAQEKFKGPETKQARLG